MLTNDTAVVTGAASGNGRAIAQRFAEHGADVVIADIQEEPRQGGQPTHELVSDEHDISAKFVETDVTDTDDLDAAVEAAEEFGGIDHMVNNAGIFRAEEFLEVTEEEYQFLMDINTRGVFFGASGSCPTTRRERRRHNYQYFERGRFGGLCGSCDVHGLKRCRPVTHLLIGCEAWT